MKQVAIVMAVYNGERFLQEQLTSILNQSYENFFLYVFDDCSTDSTKEIIQSFMAKDTRIKYTRNLENKGYALNFISGIQQVYREADIVFLSDQDDIWAPNKLEIMLSVFDHHSEIGLLISDDINFSIDKPDMIVKTKKINKVRKVKAEELMKRGAFRGMNIALSYNFLNMIFCSPSFPCNYTAHDWLLELYACKYGCMYKLDVPLAFHRMHENNTANAGNDTTSKYTIRVSSTNKKIHIYTWALNNIDDKIIKKYAYINLSHHQKRLRLLITDSFFIKFCIFFDLEMDVLKYHFPQKRICADLFYSFIR